MRILYFDAPMGVSGDMCLAALVDLGVDVRAVLREVKKLPLAKSERFEVTTKREMRHSVSCATFRVKLGHSHHHRSYAEIRKGILGSALAPAVKKMSAEIFKTIAIAEGKIHGISPEKVHFHEIGAVDSIIDIVGVSAALVSLKIDSFASSAIPLGKGWAKTMHGTIPIPAPATIEILRGVPLADSTAPFELTTPTGAAIIKTLVTQFGGLPSMTVEGIGYGAGKKDFKDSANLLRLVVGSRAKGAGPEDQEKIYSIETNIDDMTPQLSAYLVERLYAVGAVEAYIAPVIMKKGRPGIVVTALAHEGEKEAVVEEFFTQSSTIGLRISQIERRCLARSMEKIRTAFGTVSMKVSYRDGLVVHAQPEYEECRNIAEKKRIPLKKVVDEAQRAMRNLHAKRRK